MTLYIIRDVESKMWYTEDCILRYWVRDEAHATRYSDFRHALSIAQALRPKRPLIVHRISAT